MMELEAVDIALWYQQNILCLYNVRLRGMFTKILFICTCNKRRDEKISFEAEC